MSKLAHSNQETMDEIIRRDQVGDDGPNEGHVSDRRCWSNVVAPDGSCIACNAIQGEACQMPVDRPQDKDFPF